MIKKLLSLFLISSLMTSSALGDISNSTVSAFISDSSGNSISSTSGSLNSNVTNTVPVSQSGVWTVSTSGTTAVTQSTIPWADNITQFGGNNIVTGTGASGVGIPRMTVSNDSNILATQSGAWTTGRTWTLLNSTDSVNAVESGTWNITNISGTISLPTGAATSANQTNGTQETQLIDGSGHLGTIKPASTASIATDTALVTAFSPNSPLPTGSNVIGALTANQSINLNQVGGSGFALGQQAASGSIPVVTQADFSPATQNVTVQDTNTSSTTGANNQTFYTGTPTAGSAASFSFSSFENVQVLVTGTWTGTLQTEISQDSGTTWTTRGLKQSGAAYLSSSFTGNFQGEATVAGMTNFRVRATAAMTGTATVKITNSLNPSSIIVSNPLTLRDSTTQTIANTIKAASTPAATTDTALVVAVSPNNTVAVTQSTTPWGDNITQFGSSAVVTGTGASGSGIPRVTVSNDSNILATQSGTWTVQQGTPPWAVNHTQVAGSAISTAATGTQKVGIVGNAGAVFDAAQGATAPANTLSMGGVFNTSLPTISNGDISAVQIDAKGQLFEDLNYIGGIAVVTAGVSGLLAVGGNVASAASDSGDPVKIGGVYTTSVPTLTTGQRGNILIDVNGNTQVVGNIASGSSDSGNPVKTGGIYESSQTSVSTGQRNNFHTTAFGDTTTGDNTSYKHITTATTTVVKSGAGLLYAICFNKLTNAATDTIYDNTAGSGTQIGIVTETNGGSGIYPTGCQRYNGVVFSTGLTIVTSGASDLTVLYK